MRAWIEGLDTLDDIPCDVLRGAITIVPNNKSPINPSVKQKGKLRVPLCTHFGKLEVMLGSG